MTRVQRRAQALLAVAALGAAGMFLGGEGTFGIDWGPVGAALLYGALWVFVIQLARHAGEVFPDEWSRAEKQAWIAMVFVSLISLHMSSFIAVLPGLGAEADQLANPATRPLWTNLGLLILGWIVVSALSRRQDVGGVELDERDLRIAHGAARFTDGVTTLLVVGLVVTLVVLPEYSRSWLRPLIAANLLIALLIGRALVANIYTVLRYRRERG